MAAKNFVLVFMMNSCLGHEWQDIPAMHCIEARRRARRMSQDSGFVAPCDTPPV
jgi:hypothetical protein